jgi:hypothetical protein
MWTTIVHRVSAPSAAPSVRRHRNGLTVETDPWDHWPANPAADLARMADLGVDRTFVAIAGPDTPHRIERLAEARP